ncbi:hypothetical protein [Vibrio parahaemolyticus]|uniref:hypothetical protein n=1 Tax=Vibrio parahaemolyticus TaxID=670 RepID=UPI00235F1936|nr:hypothetical protein [Vibrio parahaemolyticus]EJE8515947.1 hypothetical protein [Vibrio parahaemolyticus]EJE8774743.1 hypothetical protein [Vibrio parahaemolyticus]MDF4745723.1 hypothetical protein [Vibrio parahaemolyticus]
MRTLPISIYTFVILILLYPWFLKAFYLGNIGEIGRWLSLMAMAMAFATPLYSLYLSIQLRKEKAITRTVASQRHFVLLGAIVPSLFTLIGVVLYMLGMGSTSELVVYYSFWIIAAIAFLKFKAFGEPNSKLASPMLRISHGISSLILITFIGAHLVNHLSANWGGDTHIELMEALRNYYRAPFVEVTLLAIFAFQVISGLILLSRHLNHASDGYRTTQLATGLLIMVFLLSHVTAVIGLGRSFLSIDTNWEWLTFAPGLLLDPFNVRLIVHYGLGVLALLIHILLGLRVVIASHKGEALANKVFWLAVMIPFILVYFVMRPLILA